MDQYQLELLYKVQRMEAAREHARLRADAELGAGAPPRRPVRGHIATGLRALAARLAPAPEPLSVPPRPEAGAARP